MSDLSNLCHEGLHFKRHSIDFSLMTTPKTSETVAIIGASDKDGRYAKLAQELLIEKGHNVVPINPVKDNIGGLKAYPSIADVPASTSIDTVTLYVRPELIERHVQPIIDRRVRRVIFNPGTESDTHEAEFKKAGIKVEEACTLILLRTGQF